MKDAFCSACVDSTATMRCSDCQAHFLCKPSRCISASAPQWFDLCCSNPFFLEELSDSLHQIFEVFTNRPCLGYRTSTTPYNWLSYGKVLKLAQQFALGLRFLLKGPICDLRIGLACSNCPEWLVSDLALLISGSCSFVFSTNIAPAELLSQLHFAELDAIICDEKLAPLLARMPKRPPSLVVADLHSTPYACEGFISFQELVSIGKTFSKLDPLPIFSIPLDRVVSVHLTSGSTGNPKGVGITAGMILAFLGKPLSCSPPLVFFLKDHLSYIRDRARFYATLYSGGKTGLAFSLQTLYQDLQSIRPTAIEGVPRFFGKLLEEYRKRTGKGSSLATRVQALVEIRNMFGNRLESLTIGGAPVSPLLLSFLKGGVFSEIVVESYGCTEVGVIAIDGFIVPGVKFKLLDCEDSECFLSDLPFPRGELCVKTKHMTKGYHQNCSGAENFLSNGYFRTGDLVELLDERRIRLIGRSNAMLKTNAGLFVPTEKVELLLATLDSIDQAFVGLSQEGFLQAIVVTSSDVSEISQRISEILLELPSYQRPVFLFCDSTPWTVENGLLTDSGKLRRSALKAKYQHTVGKSINFSADFALPSSDSPLWALGVDSLSALKLSFQLKEQNIHLSVEQILSSPSSGFSSQQDSRWGAAQLALQDAKVPIPICLSNSSGNQILLTGVTGFIGSHVLQELLRTPNTTIVCLVRKIPTQLVEEQRVQLVLGDLALEKFGLSSALYQSLCESVDCVIHTAAHVNHTMPYEALRSVNVIGLRAMAEFCLTGSRKKLLFLSSMSDSEEENFREPELCRLNGYALTKWAGEKILRRQQALGLDVVIIKCGFVTFHSGTGRGNPEDWLARLISLCLQLSAAPDFLLLPLLPVDRLARLVVEMRSSRSRVLLLPATARLNWKKFWAQHTELTFLPPFLWRSLLEEENIPFHQILCQFPIPPSKSLPKLSEEANAAFAEWIFKTKN